MALPSELDVPWDLKTREAKAWAKQQSAELLFMVVETGQRTSQLQMAAQVELNRRHKQIYSISRIGEYVDQDDI